MTGVRCIEDMRSILDAWNPLQMEKCLVAILKVKIAVDLDARIFWQLADVATEWTMRETDHARECLWCRVVDELAQQWVAGLRGCDNVSMRRLSD